MKTRVSKYIIIVMFTSPPPPAGRRGLKCLTDWDNTNTATTSLPTVGCVTRRDGRISIQHRNLIISPLSPAQSGQSEENMAHGIWLIRYLHFAVKQWKIFIWEINICTELDYITQSDIEEPRKENCVVHIWFGWTQFEILLLMSRGVWWWDV